MRYYAKIIKKFKTGEMIFHENDECDGMYLIDSGRVRVFKTIVCNQEKRDVDLCTLGQKSMFGEMAMLDEARRSASVQAIEDTACTIITKKIFEDQLNRVPPWMMNLIKILVIRLRETNDRLRQIAQEGATRETGTHTPEPIRCNLPEIRPARPQTIILPAPIQESEPEPMVAVPEQGHEQQDINFSEDVLHSLFKQYGQQPPVPPPC
jgi:signal-transduction protein with cAMP-binding, CBS, and nucleotidyltransferase domain